MTLLGIVYFVYSTLVEQQPLVPHDNTLGSGLAKFSVPNGTQCHNSMSVLPVCSRATAQRRDTDGWPCCNNMLLVPAS